MNIAALPVPTPNNLVSRETYVVTPLHRALLEHLERIGLSSERPSGEALSKDEVRVVHSAHRQQAAEAERRLLKRRGGALLSHFAAGSEIEPAKITPYLVEVRADTFEADLFRAATLLWSVPVSRGFGRRLRFLVRDGQNDKLIGIMALGDPVFNLRARDQWIGWDVKTRTANLVNVMDAYVLGAVPPYSQIIGGKLVASLVASREVGALFDQKYNKSTGVISGEAKNAHLLLATTTSSLGRSSIYNRLKLPRLVEFQRLGYTEGWGHFQIPDEIFEEMRLLLAAEGHKYASGHKYGDGPNWRVRVINAALSRMGLPDKLLRHGIKREVYGIPLANNWRECLSGKSKEPQINRPTVEELSEACLYRWILKRAADDLAYLAWTREQTLEVIMRHFAQPVIVNSAFL